MPGIVALASLFLTVGLAGATSGTVAAGAAVTFTVTADGTPPFSYQWWKDGAAIGGATDAAYTIAAAQPADAGDYHAVVGNAAGATMSDTASLLVNPSGTALLQFPSGIALDGAGNLYVADTSANTILKINPAGAASVLAGSAGQAGSQDGMGSAARFNAPVGVAVDANGTVYVAEKGNAAIRTVSAAGAVATLAGSAAARGSQDGAGSAAAFNSPEGIALDRAGNLVVADAFNATIRRITPAGQVGTLCGSPGNPGEADGAGPAARFNEPTGVVADAAGSIYVADTYNDTLRKVAPDGSVTTLAGSAGLSGGNDGTGAYALFSQPCGVAVDAAGNIYVADTGNSTIRRIAPAGTVTTVAGVAGIAGLGDGAGSTALFNRPRGLAPDGAGGLWVADTGNAAIRRITAAGLVTTFTIVAAVPPESAPTPAPASGATSGAPAATGGGAMNPGFLLLLALMSAARWMRRDSRRLRFGWR